MFVIMSIKQNVNFIQTCIIRMDLANLYAVFIYQCLIGTHRYLCAIDILCLKFLILNCYIYIHIKMLSKWYFYCLYKIFSFHSHLGIFLFMPCFNAWDCLKMDVLFDFVCTSICTSDFFCCNSTCLFLSICWLCVFPQTHFPVSSNQYYMDCNFLRAEQ